MEFEKAETEETENSASDMGNIGCEAPLNSDAAPSLTEDTARRRVIEEMFEGKTMSYFDMATLALEYHEIYKRHFAQTAQKPRKGRPGVVSAMARELAVPGGSEAAKRAWIERALKVARMSPEARVAAKKAKLDRNRSALYEIIDCGNSSAKQMQKIREIELSKAKRKQETKAFIKKTIRIPVAREDEVVAELIALAEKMEVEVI
jgi:hypothetical protein